MVVSIEEFKADSIYWGLFTAERDFYYRLYKHNGGTKSRATFLDDLFTEAYPPDRYEFACNQDPAESDTSHPCAYRAKSGAGYVYDSDGDFFQVRYKDTDGSILETFYIHRSQFFKPVSYAKRAMGVIATTMAVAFQNTKTQLAKMADYIREAEMINAKVADLNRLYSDLNLLLSGFTDLGNKYAVTTVYPEQKLWERLTAHGFIELAHVIKMGIKFRPILLRIDLTDGKDWLAFWLEYSSNENAIKSHQYSRHNAALTTNNWSVNDQGEALGQISGGNASHVYPSAVETARILSLENKKVHFNINSANRLLLGGENSQCYDTIDNGNGTWRIGNLIAEHEKFGGSRDSGYNNDERNDFSIPLVPFMLQTGDTIETIIKDGKESLVRIWDVRKFMDDVRQKIEYTNNMLQPATTCISQANQDVQENFSTATGIISNAGQQLCQAAKFIRL
ncbi:MAG: hypothetical protein LBI34_02115 [Puniceicoccales bacterium]|nr:hypothetical protein [Puniceicoccales bacterium]